MGATNPGVPDRPAALEASGAWRARWGWERGQHQVCIDHRAQLEHARENAGFAGGAMSGGEIGDGSAAGKRLSHESE